MATNLFEAYKKRISIAEGVYAKAHNGEKMDDHRKLVVAKCLENVNHFLNEAFENSIGTQRSDLGLWKKFAINLTNVALPNLIAHDIVLVQPMSSMSGYLTYMKYTYGSNKGTTAQGTTFNDPFRLGSVDANYSSAKVVEAKTAVAAGGVVSGTLNWKPVIKNSVEFVIDSVSYRDDGEGHIYKGRTVTTVPTTDKSGNVIPAGTVITAGTLVASSSIAYDTGVYSFTDANLTASTAVLCNYIYDNVIIPQNDIPMVSAEQAAIPLLAKFRRVAVYYSQIAQYQAKADYGIDLGEALASQAVGQLQYEIDTEICNLIIDNATEATELVWSKTVPIGISKREHYEDFAEVLSIGAQKIYDRTRRFTPNWMLVASDILPILNFCKGFTPANTGKINGPYFAGTFNGIKVFVTPNITAGKFVIGVNGDDYMSACAVYAPYMAILPTQLLQYSDGGTTQGFSTGYALEMLNDELIVAGRVTA